LSQPWKQKPPQSGAFALQRRCCWGLGTPHAEGQGPAVGEGRWSSALTKGRETRGQQPNSGTPALAKLQGDMARASPSHWIHEAHTPHLQSFDDRFLGRRKKQL